MDKCSHLIAARGPGRSLKYSMRSPVSTPTKGQPMDNATTRDHIQKHADAIVRGDMDTVGADFSDELRPSLPQLAQALPQPVTSAEVLSVDIGDPTSVAMIRYSGDDSSVTIRSQWQDVGGEHPVIIQAEPAD
jgi:hypothetical protein